MRNKVIWPFLKKYLFSNITAKVMALAMALAVWLYAQSYSYVRPREFDVPVDVSLPPGWSLASEDSITVIASMSYLRRFDREVQQMAYGPRQVYVRCDIVPDEHGADEQTVSVPLKPSDMVAPREYNVRVNSFHPAEIPIRVTREAVVSLTVRPEFTVPTGYELTEWRVVPKMARVRGRKDVLLKVTEIGTEAFDINAPPGRKVEWVDEQIIRLADHVVAGDVRYPVKLDDREVKCRYTLTQVARKRSFKGIPVSILAPPTYPHQAELLREPRTDVTVSGPVDVVESLKPENIVLYVDVGNLIPSPQELAYTQPIQSQIVNTPGARDLTIKLAAETCAVKISEKPPK